MRHLSQFGMGSSCSLSFPLLMVVNNFHVRFAFGRISVPIVNLRSDVFALMGLHSRQVGMVGRLLNGGTPASGPVSYRCGRGRSWCSLRFLPLLHLAHFSLKFDSPASERMSLDISSLPLFRSWRRLPRFVRGRLRRPVRCRCRFLLPDLSGEKEGGTSRHGYFFWQNTRTRASVSVLARVRVLLVPSNFSE